MGQKGNWMLKLIESLGLNELDEPLIMRPRLKDICKIDIEDKRICEHGTKNCIVHHSEK